MNSTPQAELLFHSGSVFTADGASGPARTAVAVADGRILAVGAQALDLAGPRTERVDLAGRLLVPGFQDSHIHAVFGGLELGRCDLSALKTAEEYLAAIGHYAHAHPEQEWITGGGWSLESFPGGLPTASALDAVVPDRPVFLPNRDHHGAWVNSRALGLAGITRDTPDPADGRIERDGRGEPIGVLQEGAVVLVESLLPKISEQEYDAAFDRAQALLHSLGITGWQDALVGAGIGLPDNFEVYLRAAVSGRLTARVRGALWWERERGAEQIAGLLERRRIGRGAGNGRFDPGSVKIMQDGIIENRTAALNSPYFEPCACRGHGGEPAGESGSGLSFVDPAKLGGYVAELDRLGFQVHFHALGDRAVREALDALEAALAANGGLGHRHHLAHLQVVHPDDVPRFAALGATANIQPLWACHEPQMDELAIPLLGPERAQWQYPFAALRAAGAELAAGSDWPVTSPDPIQGIHVAVNRVAPGEGGAALIPSEKLTLAQALAAYTAGSARVNHVDQAGRIAPGMLADLAVLDRDPFGAPEEEIHEARVTATYVAGQAVFQA
ncbi:amidohydrolase [Actinospica robiniae]|uniref:amidohydrolase n=1 Tax=Actinospica robiniae TaxID=304901 RepID=UPI00054E45AF|nr:amidohydrolase [Actinospica robiniae]